LAPGASALRFLLLRIKVGTAVTIHVATESPPRLTSGDMLGIDVRKKFKHSKRLAQK
jgi:hypothetical protein